MNGDNQICEDNNNVIIGVFKNGQPLKVSRKFLKSIRNLEECKTFDVKQVNNNVEDLIKCIEFTPFDLNTYITGNFNNTKYNIAPELIGKMNFIYGMNMTSPYYDNIMLFKVTDNNDGTVNIGLVFEPSAEDKEALKKEFADLNEGYKIPIE